MLRMERDFSPLKCRHLLISFRKIMRKTSRPLWTPRAYVGQRRTPQSKTVEPAVGEAQVDSVHSAEEHSGGTNHSFVWVLVSLPLPLTNSITVASHPPQTPLDPGKSWPMKAIILVGGYGTRLRPLTLSRPKPLVEFANKPMILHQIEALKGVGVTEIILAINYQPQVMLAFLEEYQNKLGIKITCSQESEPLGTAGPLALARETLMEEPNHPFFVLNSDIACEYPLRELIDFHGAHEGEASIVVTQVDEPSKYGVVVIDTETAGRVQEFVEKPSKFVGNKINAGIYLLNTSVIDRITLRPTSMELEVFPFIAGEGKLYAMVLKGFWMDIGQPKDYLIGLRLYLDYLRSNFPNELASGSSISGNVLIDETAKIGEGCKIGPDVSVGPGCVLESGVRLSSCTLMKGVRVKNSAHVSSSIIGWHSTIGESAQVSNMSVLGEHVWVNDTLFLNGVVVLPHKEISSHYIKPEIVM